MVTYILWGKHNMFIGRNWSAILLLVLIVGSAVVGRLAHSQPPLLIGAVTLVMMGLAMVLCIPLWRAFDEVSRDAHKTTWSYGGQIGLAVAGAVFVWALASGQNLQTPPLASLSRGSLLAAGIALTFGLQVVGYVLFWAGWWISKR